MTTVSKNKRRPPGRPTNSPKLQSQSNTLTTIFAGTSIDSELKARKKNKLERISDDTIMEEETTPRNVWDIENDDEEMKDTTTTTTTDDSTGNNKDQTPEKETSITKETTIIEDDSTAKTNPEDPEVLEVEDPATPTQTNSAKKRDRKLGTKEKKKTVQRTLFDKDTRSFKCMNVFNTRFDLSFCVPASDKPLEEAPNPGISKCLQ